MADRLAELLEAELSAGVSELEAPPAGSPVDLTPAPGLSLREARSELAQLLAGTDDRGSRAYRSARRQAERYLLSDAQRAAGRRPPRATPVTRWRLVGARRQQNAKLRQYRAGGADARLRVSWYGERRPEWLPAGRWLHIPRAAMREVVHAHADGEHELAAGRFFDEFARQYRVPNHDDWLADVEVVDLAIRPAGG